MRFATTEWGGRAGTHQGRRSHECVHAEALGDEHQKFDQERAAGSEADHEMALLMNDKFDT